METWDVARSQRVCAVSNKIFDVGESYFSALKTDKDGFVRFDYAPEIWAQQNHQDFFSFWRRKVPAESERKKNHLLIDTEAFYQFMQSLLAENQPTRAIFRYLLALILVRKRVFRLDEIEKTADGEILHLHDSRAKSELEIPVPIATPDELNAAQIELNQLLGND